MLGLGQGQEDATTPPGERRIDPFEFCHTVPESASLYIILLPESKPVPGLGRGREGAATPPPRGASHQLF